MRQKADAAAAKAREEAQRADEGATKARQAAEDARREQDKAEQQVYFGKIALADREWEGLAWPRSADLLNSCPPDRHGWEYDYLFNKFNRLGQYALKGHTRDVSSVSFSPDGTRLASGGDNTVKLWDARSGQEILTLKGHTDRVTSVTFSPDGSCLASGSSDRTVKVWDARSNPQVRRLRGHTADVVRVAFTADGKRIVSHDKAGNTLVWNQYGLLLAEPPPTDLRDGPVSPDGNWKVEIRKHCIDLVSTRRRDFWKEMLDRHQAMAPTWLYEDAAAAAKAQNWFAAAFHLGRLQQWKPDDQSVKRRYAAALARLKEASIPPPRLPLPPPDPAKTP